MTSPAATRSYMSSCRRSISPGHRTTYYEANECDKYLVCTGQLPNQQIDPIVPWVMNNMGKSVYVMGSDYVWPRGSTEQLNKALEANGGSLVGADFFPFGTQDFGPAFSKIKDANPDIVWFMFAGSDSITSVKQYRSFGMKPELVYHGWDEANLRAVTPGEQAGIIASMAYFQQLDTPVNNAFVKHFADKYGADKPINAIGPRGARRAERAAHGYSGRDQERRRHSATRTPTSASRRCRRRALRRAGRPLRPPCRRSGRQWFRSALQHIGRLRSRGRESRAPALAPTSTCAAPVHGGTSHLLGAHQ